MARARALATVVLLVALTAGPLRVWVLPTRHSLWTVSVGGGPPAGSIPLAVAVDAWTDRVFVVTSGGTGRTPDLWGWVPGVQQVRRWLPWLPRPSLGIEPGTVSVLDAARV